jgi:hypothetical protein
MPREFEIRKEVELEATPEQVWEAIATGQGIASWFMALPVEPGPDGTSPLGAADVWDPPNRFLVRTPDGQAFEYLIEARAGGSSVLRFVHSGFHGDDWESEYEATNRGWDMYMHTLAQYLKYFPGRFATYISAEGPPSSARPEAWDVLLRALGMPGRLAAGDKVRLTPDGLTPIDGVVDYVMPSFLGVRTDGALYRFHGRAILGMAIATGHHIFTEDVDAEATGKAWQSWLHNALG